MHKWLALALFLVASPAFAQTTRPGETPSALDFEVTTLDGQPKHLGDYAGKVVLVVNTASKCGHTPQYAGLEAMYRKYEDQGLVVLGFPANNFNAQEPGSNLEIAEFCEQNYGVTFPMFSKVSVKGEDQCPLYAYLTSHADPSGEVAWNFEKFLIGRDGEIVGRFKPGVKPDAPEVTAAVESALAE